VQTFDQAAHLWRYPLDLRDAGRRSGGNPDLHRDVHLCRGIKHGEGIP
jgi:hypothetical protein